MANTHHLAILKRGPKAWNEWRETNPDVRPDLSNVDFAQKDLGFSEFGVASLHDINFSKADLRSCSLRNALVDRSNLDGAYLVRADLCFATFEECSIRGANLRLTRLGSASFTHCDLSGSDLAYATTEETSFEGSTLRAANLKNIGLIKVNFDNAVLDSCLVYGTASWDVSMEGTEQLDLVITEIDPAIGLMGDQPILTVDNLEVAQFIYLLLSSPKIRDIIDTIGQKAVLILGRFTKPRKAVLDALRNELRRRDYVPIVFDFEKPAGRDLTETVSTLAHLSRFVIADLTDAKSVPQELQQIVPDLPSVPVQPILLASQREYAMFEHFKSYPWVLETHLYEDKDSLLAEASDLVEAAEAKVEELRK